MRAIEVLREAEIPPPQEITECEPGSGPAWKDVTERVGGRPAPEFAARTEPDGGPVEGRLTHVVGTEDIERDMHRAPERLDGLLS